IGSRNEQHRRAIPKNDRSPPLAGARSAGLQACNGPPRVGSPEGLRYASGGHRASVMKPFDFQLRTRIVFGDGALARLGELARELGFTRALIVADPGIVATGQVARAASVLGAAGIAS